MDLEFTAEEKAFRDEVRTFIRENLPEGTRTRMKEGRGTSKQDMVDWMKILADKGWSAPRWPKEYGGPGWNAIQQYIFTEEIQLNHAPDPQGFNISMVGPVIYTFGNDAQKKKFLPSILDCSVWWCQGFSEPGAGSDLASLKTKAVREGDEYVVNGQKTWTTYAQHADWIFCLVRTDPDAPKKQQGISFLLIDMKTPGITVRPLITLDLGHHLNEVFFEDVRVPAENLIGEENKGWDYAKFLLAHERVGVAEIGKFNRYLAQLRKLLAETREGGRPLSEDPGFRRRVAELEMNLSTVKAMHADALAQGTPGLISAAALKIRGSELQQAILQTLTDVLGRHGLAYQADALMAGWNGELVGPEESAGILAEHLHRRAATIYGGSSEIQRNIIAKGALGL